MTITIPDAALVENPLALALEAGILTPGDLAPLATHLDALVASNIASTKLMVDRHRGTPVEEFYTLSHESEREAHRLLQPFVTPFTEPEASTCLDAVAMGYPAHIARIAVTGTCWDYPVSFLHLVRASTRCYRHLREALADTGAFTDSGLEHFAYFGHVDDEEIHAIESLLTEAPTAAHNPALQLAGHLAVFEDLFWQRMVTVCTPQAAP
ncbi:hypothetical protein [Nesterenkonia alkaliphila]|uniref:hypothetical protein n=1 Tax=Nesterenkonia alkaliphila TaxID=1463631 RepID=UPI00166A696B|nr:hypothetical protein [Nesterenkonia alkaliphila]GFZ97080.1 hypothetical protein GCM10011359_28090 [Nesterenkonia alkaliphila]